MFGIAAFVKQAAVHAWVQSFHAPFEHFGKGGETGNLAHRHIFFAQEISRSTGGDDVHALALERARERGDTGFVRNRNECAADLHLNV